MKQNMFEKMCVALYDLTRKQRDGLLDLLQSRIWMYKSDEEAVLDNCHEDDDDSIKMYLSKCPQEFVNFVMKGKPEDIRKRFSRLMSDSIPYEFERIFEFEDDSIKIILQKISMVSLSYALKGGSDDLRHKFSKNMSKTKAAQLKHEMEALGPVRVSSVLIAQGVILDAINALAAKSKIELPLSFDTIVAKSNSISTPADNNDDNMLQVRILFTLDDYNLRKLIREIESNLWVDFLWYLNDARLSRKVFSFNSPHICNTLIRDWSNRWENVKVESASESQLKKGLIAMQKVIGTFRQMVENGQIDFPNE